MKVDRDRVGEHAAAIELDPEQLADLAVCAVGANEVFPTQPAFLSALDVPHRCGHPIGVLLDANDLGALDHRRACLFGSRAQNRLEARLGDEQPSRRTQRLHTFIETGNQTGQLRARQRVHQNDGALGLELFQRLLANLFLDARGAEHLQRPHVEERGARDR